MSQILRNDGLKLDYLLTDYPTVPFRYSGVVTLCRFQKEAGVAVTPSLVLYMDGMSSFMPMALEEIREVAKALGMEFQLDTPEDRRGRIVPIRNKENRLVISLEALMTMLGKNPVDYENQKWISENGLITRADTGYYNNEPCPVYSRKAVGAEVQIAISSARRWIHQNMRAFKRANKLDDWTAVQLWQIGTKDNLTILRHKVGETIQIQTSGGSHFGSGGSWGRYEIFGMANEKVGDQTDSGFVIYTTRQITSHGPAAIYVASGDGVGAGRVHGRVLHILE